MQTEYGDTLQRVAYRELQDASRWPEIAWLNELRPPYLTSDPTHPDVAKGRVLIYGSSLRIPSPLDIRQSIDQAQAFGIDVGLTKGLLDVDESGGLQLFSGGRNLRQALEFRLQNMAGCLQFHPKYGNAAHRIKGRKAEAHSRLLALRFCEECVLGDPRVQSVIDGSAQQVGDTIAVGITAVVTDGAPLRLQVEI